MKLFSQTLEMSVLHAICEGGKESNSLLARVQQDYFYTDNTREVIDRIFALAKSSGEIPSFAELQGDPVLAESTRDKLRKYSKALPEKSKYKKLVRNLEQFHQARKLYTISESINKQLLEDKVDTEALLEKTADELSKARVRTESAQEIFHLGKSNSTSQVVKNLLDKKKVPKLVPTGFDAFDNTNMGFSYGALVGLAGPAGSGKTGLSLQMALNMTRKCRENVAYVSLEMTEEECMERLLANLADLPLWKIKHKKLKEDEEKQVKKAYSSFVKDLQKDGTRLTIFAPSNGVTIQETLLTLKPFGYRVIIVDYLTLLKGSGGNDTDKQWATLGDIGRQCKAYAKATDSVVILLAQVSEEGALRYGKALAEDANYLWIWPVSQETRDAREMRIQQIKARNASLFPFVLKYDPDKFQVFDDPDTDYKGSSKENSDKDSRSSKHKDKPSKDDKDGDYFDEI